ncbi:prolyl oligopeptidase family serine peptidase [Nonomuraea soli]|uniref:prolyl oligopeptidase n=1 Tax=Nonomuraea soli TaxID=1032476 RepID=A0A7W0HSJ4_9ACTN|nr:prolyl oligopeptidase family serine peptidase [Nonomuraea soli]MBA2893726.1 prolyl oligopeptidase [Nonomuraea soli]
MQDYPYPEAPRSDAVERLHGKTLSDPYRWLEDPESAESRGWLAAQESLWRRHAATIPLDSPVLTRIGQAAGAGLVTSPRWRGRHRFHLRRTAGQAHPVLFRDGHPLLDPNLLDPDGRVSLLAWHPDAEGRRVACQFARSTAAQPALYIVDADTGQVIDGPMLGCGPSLAWPPGGACFFYTRAGHVLRHRIGAPARDDVRITGEPGDYRLAASDDGRWVILTCVTAAGDDVWLVDPLEPGVPRAVHVGLDARATVSVGPDGRVYVMTTMGAERGRLCVADAATPGQWRELVAEDPLATLTGFAVLDGPALGRPVLLVSHTRDAISELALHDLLTGTRLRPVSLPGAGSTGPLVTRARPAYEAFFTYTDHVTPPAILRFDARDRGVETWMQAPGTVGHEPVTGHRVTCTSRDGTRIPLTILARRDLRGPRPAILYGFGAFGIPLTPAYSSHVLPWLDAGGVFALAGVRGGGEGGPGWHEAARRGTKQRSFDDLIAAAQALVELGWTTPDRLGLCGESHGGLLVGAVITQRPELCAAAVLVEPVLDMVRYEHSPPAAEWREEYGSADDPVELSWLLSYSPYHHVKPGVAYPATLFVVQRDGARADAMHARKMCAAMQAATTSRRPVLLRHERGRGSDCLARDLLSFMGVHTGLISPA